MQKKSIFLPATPHTYDLEILHSTRKSNFPVFHQEIYFFFVGKVRATTIEKHESVLCTSRDSSALSFLLLFPTPRHPSFTLVFFSLIELVNPKRVTRNVGPSTKSFRQNGLVAYFPSLFN